MRGALTALCIVAASVVPFAQAQAPNRAPVLRALRGVVAAAGENGSPLRRVRIEVVAAGVSADPVFTDDEGRFELLVPEQSHELTFIKAGFVRQEMNRPAAAGNAALSIRLVPGAVITGRVVDQFGDAALGRVRVRGAAREVIVDTDPLGEFRAGGLPAGRYDVAVLAGFRPTAQPDRTLPPVTVSVSAGEEVVAVLPAMLFGLGVGAQDQGRAVPPRATDTGTIRGRVVGPSGVPAGGTGVYLAGTGTERRSFITEANGQFTFDRLAADAYALTAMKTGPSYFTEGAEARFVVRQGQLLENVTLTTSRPPLIAGIVTDPHGEPLEGITVELWQRQSGNGRALLLPLNDATTKSRTDDRGRYRLLAGPGTYYVVATDDRATDRGTAAWGGAVRVYYPGTSTLTDAVPVRTEWGREAPPMDMTFAARATGRIQGFALDAAGRPLNAPVTLLDSVRSGVPTPSPRIAAVGPDGAFSFADVPPGDYALQAMVAEPGGRAAEFSLTYVTLADGDTAAVTIRTTAGTTLRGRIVTENGDAPPRVRTFGLSVQNTDGDYIGLGRSMPYAVVAEDGSFELAGLHGPLRLTASAPPGWWLKSVGIGVIDAAEHPFTFGGGTPKIDSVDAVFADTAGEVMGRVVDKGSRVADYSVLVFSTDRHRWWAPSGYVTLARPNPPDGMFRALSMPPGDYLAVAVDRFDVSTEWLDPEILAGLASSARRLTVREREVVTTELNLVRRPR